MITCDTHVLLYWVLAPQRLSPPALRALEGGRVEGALACADIVFWEIAMLAGKQRILLPVATAQFMEDLRQGLRLAVLPITPAIAVRAQAAAIPHGAPADRLIAATALELGVPLISADHQLAQVAGLRVIW